MNTPNHIRTHRRNMTACRLSAQRLRTVFLSDINQATASNLSRLQAAEHHLADLQRRHRAAVVEAISHASRF